MVGREGVVAYLGVGSNRGNAKANIEKALRLLRELSGCAVTSVSSLYRTSPVGPRQKNFMNAAVKLRTSLSPGDLLSAVKSAERVMGRADLPERWGPRIIDIDILFYGGRRIKTPGLSIPHPELFRRRFVLEPLAEIAPGLVHPGLRVTIRKLRDAAVLTYPEQKVKIVNDRGENADGCNDCL